MDIVVSDISAEQITNNIWGGLESDGVENISGAEVTLGGYDAFQVYGDYIDSFGETAVIVVWVFEDEIGVKHYVAIEAQDIDIIDAVHYVESSFSLYK